MKDVVYIFLGGGLGSVLRYACFQLIPKHAFPYSTLTVNILGSFLIGLLVSIFNSQSTSFSSNPSLLLLLSTGLCGGFTTFSTFSLENYNLLQQQQFGLLLLYIFSSLLFCIAATALGFYLGKA
jgi:CrcB protein